MKSSQQKSGPGSPVTGNALFATPLTETAEVCVDCSRKEIYVESRSKVDRTSTYLSGHFPDITIYPGVFILESLRAAISSAIGPESERVVDVQCVRSARFVAPLLCGDEFILQATIKQREKGQPLEVEANCIRPDGAAIAQIGATFAFIGDV